MNIKKHDEEIKKIREEFLSALKEPEVKTTGETLNSKVKDWYLCAFPSDDMGNDIDSEVTFSDVYKGLENVYFTLNCCDSIIRKRVFEKLGELLGKSYDYVYQRWLRPELYK